MSRADWDFQEMKLAQVGQFESFSNFLFSLFPSPLLSLFSPPLPVLDFVGCQLRTDALLSRESRPTLQQLHGCASCGQIISWRPLLCSLSHTFIFLLGLLIPHLSSTWRPCHAKLSSTSTGGVIRAFDWRRRPLGSLSAQLHHSWSWSRLFHFQPGPWFGHNPAGPPFRAS